MIGKCSNQVSSLDLVQSLSPRPRDVRHLIPTVDSSKDASELMFESSQFLGEDRDYTCADLIPDEDRYLNYHQEEPLLVIHGAFQQISPQ